VENPSRNVEKTTSQMAHTSVPRGVNLVFEFDLDLSGLLNPTSASEV